jgi:hypothetical protein
MPRIEYARNSQYLAGGAVGQSQSIYERKCSCPSDFIVTKIKILHTAMWNLQCVEDGMPPNLSNFRMFVSLNSLRTLFPLNPDDIILAPSVSIL